jgi:septal ring factor EnvC (AmiA/AmiB activator)
VEACGGNAITGKFLVGSVPCLIRFQFENDFSWVREKVISYKVTVTPPSTETLGAGRRRRAKACLKAVQDDLENVVSRQNAAKDQLTVLETEIEQLQFELEEKKKSLQAVKAEEKWCDERVALRQEEQALLMDRLEKGWEDEH